MDIIESSIPSGRWLAPKTCKLLACFSWISASRAYFSGLDLSKLGRSLVCLASLWLNSSAYCLMLSFDYNLALSIVGSSALLLSGKYFWSCEFGELKRSLLEFSRITESSEFFSEIRRFLWHIKTRIMGVSISSWPIYHSSHRKTRKYRTHWPRSLFLTNERTFTLANCWNLSSLSSSSILQPVVVLVYGSLLRFHLKNSITVVKSTFWSSP